MMFKRLFAVGVLVVVGLGLASGSALTQQEVDVTLSFTNVCQDSTLTVNQIILSAGRSLDITITAAQIRPGQTVEFRRTLGFTPSRLDVKGSVDGQGFEVAFDPLQFNTPLRDQGEANGCLQVVVSISGGETQPPPPPTGTKPIIPGQSLDQVLGTLQAMGLSIRTEGSQADPKLGDVSDPMLLRAIPGFSAQLLWVAAPGTLRSVITWDNPAVDLDLLVFGFGACFQLSPAGVLAEICDRAPSGPVPGVIFGVLVINWSPTTQAFVLSLSP
jgi:hypothetical protein